MKVNNVELGELLGEVSTCWDADGVFKSDRVLEIQKDIENHVIKLEQQLKDADGVIDFYWRELGNQPSGFVSYGGLIREYKSKYKVKVRYENERA